MTILPTPRTVEAAVTGRCNQRCTYCSHFTSATDADRDLPKEDWLSFFEELGMCAVLRVALIGGEPFCRDDIHELISGIVENRMRFSIASNGTLITDDDAARLAATGRCDGVQISIDGPSADVHDGFRGQGSFSGAVQAVRRLREHGVPLSARVTIHRRNVRHLRRIAEFLLDDLRLPYFSTAAARSAGLCREHVSEVLLSVDERELAMRAFLDLREKYGDRTRASSGPAVEAVAWAAMTEAKRNGNTALPRGGYLTGCNGVMSHIGVRSDGVVVPCLLLAHIELGRIGRDALKRIWTDSAQLQRLRSRRAIRLDGFDFCSACEYTLYCSGGCPGLAFISTGKDDRPDPRSCLKRFLEAGGTLPCPADSRSGP
ncbi:SynChlorMet cassette radical SAM/SPASM protein ScmE [Verrucomicrobiota bacterium]